MNVNCCSCNKEFYIKPYTYKKSKTKKFSCSKKCFGKLMSSQSGRWSEEHKSHVGHSNPYKGLKRPIEIGLKISETKKKQSKKQCKHCNNLFDKSAYTRYHGNNCVEYKYKKLLPDYLFHMQLKIHSSFQINKLKMLIKKYENIDKNKANDLKLILAKSKKDLSIEEINKVLINNYNIELNTIKHNKSNTDIDIHKYKEFVYKYLKEEKKCSTVLIAKLMNRKGHSSIITSLQRINGQLEVDKKLVIEYNEFKNRLNDN